MTRDRLYEESACSVRATKERKLWMVFNIVSIVSFVLAAIHASLSMNVVSQMSSEYSGAGLALMLVEWFALLAALVGIGLIFFFMKRRFNVSYDYTFVEDELRITKVFNGRRRKFLATLKADQMLKIGWMGKDSYARAVAGLAGKKPKRMTPNRVPAEGKTFFYIVYSSSIEKSVYVIECRETMLEYLVLAAGRNKLERQ